MQKKAKMNYEDLDLKHNDKAQEFEIMSDRSYMCLCDVKICKDNIMHGFIFQKEVEI